MVLQHTAARLLAILAGMRLLAALLLLSAPAFAQSYSEREPSMQGLYAALGGGGQLLISGDNGFGYDAEARLGWSFNPGMQMYLSGALDGASIDGASIKLMTVTANLQYHLVTRGPVLAYTRVGIGLGIVPDALVVGENAVGLAESGGIGIEIRVTDQFFVVPELFYRRASVSNAGASIDVQTVGLQVAIAYY